jgi:hypothetical protein
MSRLTLALIATGAALLASACSSTPKTTLPTTQHSVTAPALVTSSAAAASASATPTASSGLSGTWTGQYGGAYTGTFTLTWTQSGSDLSGTINLNPGGTSSLHGTVNGSAISFGTVGSAAVTYSGTVAGNSMSGNYQVQGGSGSASGTWSASKS